MITGDHALSAAAIARELGLHGAVLTATGLDRIDVAELSRRIEDSAVFARVAPEHKVNILQALKVRGHVVAMTGDGGTAFNRQLFDNRKLWLALAAVLVLQAVVVNWGASPGRLRLRVVAPGRLVAGHRHCGQRAVAGRCAQARGACLAHVRGILGA